MIERRKSKATECCMTFDDAAFNLKRLLKIFTSKKRLLTPIQQSQQTAVHMIDMINKRKRKLADKSIMPGWLKLFGQRWSD